MHAGTSALDGGGMDASGRPDDGRGPVVLSATVQEWRGQRYYRCGPYFARQPGTRPVTDRPGRLHRHVWEDVEGPIPATHHIHHRDGNAANNHRANLACVPKGVHLGQHSAQPTERQRAARRQNVRIANEVRLRGRLRPEC